MELRWKIKLEKKEIESLQILSGGIFFQRLGKPFEIDLSTGSIEKCIQGQTLASNELFITSENPPTLERAKGKKRYWKQVLGTRTLDFLPFMKKRRRLLFHNIEHFNNLAVVLFDLGMKGPKGHRWREVHGREIVLLDWNTGKQIWRSSSTYEIDYWNAGGVLAVRNLLAHEYEPIPQKIRFYDTFSTKLIKELTFSGKSKLTITAQEDLIALLEKPRKSSVQGSERLTLVDAKKIELKTFEAPCKHYFVKFEKSTDLLVWESAIKTRETKVYCYSATSPELLWVWDITSFTQKRAIDPLDLISYNDLLVIVTKAPMGPSHIHEYIPPILSHSRQKW